MGLNPYQRNSLEAGLRQLELVLLRLRQTLQVPLPNGRLTRQRPMTPELSAQLARQIEALLAEIAVVAETFELQPQVEDVGQAALAEMTVAWADLHDLDPGKLGRYGVVDPALTETLAPHVQRLIELSDDLIQLVKGGS